jgi:DNA-binding protein HU-beta
VTKADLVSGVATAANVTKAEAERVMSAFFDAVKTNAKRGNKVAWPGFGSFSVTRRAARTGRNPRTGATVRIKASNAVKFTSSALLKDAVNNRRPAAKATATKAPAKKAAAKKAPAKKAPAKKATAAKKTTARKTTAKK